jgi:hypothetical protein
MSPAAANTPVLLRLLICSLLVTVLCSFFFDNNNSVGGVSSVAAASDAEREEYEKCETLYDTTRFPYSDPRPIDCHVVGESVGSYY